MKNDIERREFLLRAGSVLGGIGLASMAGSANAQTDKERKKVTKYLVRRVSEVPKERSTCGYRQRMITKDDCDKACFTFLNSHAAGRHHHNKTTEFYYVLKGNGALELDGDRVEVEPGTLVLIPPGIRHRAIGDFESLIVGIPSLDPADFFVDPA
jgi:mannose-6-phosphate isomerase-like protein (cupin superfamily)